MLSELNNARKTVGIKQSMKILETGKAKKAFVSKEAEHKVRAPFEQRCKELRVPIEYVNSLQELGKACGIKVGAAVAVICKK